MRGRLLAINQTKPPVAQLLHQADKRDFCRVVNSSEHGFCEERSSNRHAVEPADQLARTPCFNGMRIAQLVEPAVRCDHVQCNPSTTFRVLWPEPGALFHDL